MVFDTTASLMFGHYHTEGGDSSVHKEFYETALISGIFSLNSGSINAI